MNTIKEYIPFYKRNLKIALPIVFSQLGGAVVQLVDTFMVGRLGTVELAAVSFASAVFAIGYVLINIYWEYFLPYLKSYLSTINCIFKTIIAI